MTLRFLRRRPHAGWLIAALASIAAVLAPYSQFSGAASAQEQKPVAAQVDQFDLTAAPVKWEIQPGIVVDGWGYNGAVPGPLLKVREGDLVRVRLHNKLPVSTTIHWHGIDVPYDQDGVPGLSQPAVEPGADT
jgi:FtsP/CotA-like multicopper oxidase with cupredoxin domain